MLNFKMKKIFLIVSLVLAFSGFFTFWHPVLACTDTETQNSKGECVPNTFTYKTLAPLPCSSGDGCEGGKFVSFNATDANSLGKYLNIMITVVIGLAAVLAVVMIVIGGIEYMTSELPAMKEGGKNRISNAIFGLVIALGAYALMYTINPNLLRTDIQVDEAKIQIPIEAVEYQQGCAGNKCGGYAQGDDWSKLAGAQTVLPPYVHDNHNGADCAQVGDPSCTSTKGLDISAVKQTQEGCGCVVEITGGTESWLHSTGTSHKPGSSTVDLSMTPDLNKYILEKGQKAKDANGKNIYVIGGVKYLAEGTGGGSTGNHWHVYQ
jgi:hypothetical protein